MDIQTIQLEEDSIQAAEEYVANYLFEVEDQASDLPVEVSPVPKKEELPKNEVKTKEQPEKNLGLLSLQITFLWSFVLVMGVTLWYSCS